MVLENEVYHLNYWVMHPVARVSINIYIETSFRVAVRSSNAACRKEGRKPTTLSNMSFPLGYHKLSHTISILLQNMYSNINIEHNI
jgi:hypothetical protein